MWLAYGIAHRMLKFDSLVPSNCLSHPGELQVGRHNHSITHSTSTVCIAVRTLLYHSAAISYMSVLEREWFKCWAVSRPRNFHLNGLS